jgi:glycosyltransferase involved in cell wall biosynthesis
MFSVSVYCRDKGANDYLGVGRIVVPAINSSSLETISRTLVSTLHAIFILRPKVVVLMNSANAPFIPLLRITGIKVVAHVDGLEWMRPKWSGFRSKYSKWAEKRACKWANEVIADSMAIKDHILKAHNVSAVYIPYGAEHISVSPKNHAKLVAKFSSAISWKGYLLVVARWEPENHVAEIVEAHIEGAFTENLVVVGGSHYESEYSNAIEKLATRSNKIVLLGSVWDKETLDALYCGAKAYIHGHSVGGTNPSLLRAMGAGSKLVSFDCEFNRETAYDSGSYWKDQKSLIAAVSAFSKDAGVTHQTRMKFTTWDEIAKLYSDLVQRVIVSPSRTSTDLSSSARS